RTVLSLRYGLDHEAPMTLKAIGDRLGVTREWVRKIECKAIRKLRGDAPEVPSARRRRPSTAISRRRSGNHAAVGSERIAVRCKGKKSLTAVPREPRRALPVPPPVPTTGAPAIWQSRWPGLAVAARQRHTETISSL